MTPEADERSEAAPHQKAPRMPADRITYPFESDIERHTREAQERLWDPQAVIDGKGPDVWHYHHPETPEVAVCGQDLSLAGPVMPRSSRGEYLCRKCLKLRGGPF